MQSVKCQQKCTQNLGTNNKKHTEFKLQTYDMNALKLLF